MKVVQAVPPREFNAGSEARPVLMRDCGRVALEADEQVTFVTGAGGEYDVARKEWGFYATPSLNGRLGRFGLRPALVRNPAGRCFIFLQESGKEAAFDAYLSGESLEVLAWLDDEAVLAAIAGLAKA